MNPAPSPSFLYAVTSRDAGGRWRGRTIRIFKRAGRDNWYCAPKRRGVQYRTCLETDQRAAASAKAVEVCDLIWSDRIDEWKARRLRGGARAEGSSAPSVVPESATVGQVLDVYEVRSRGQRADRTPGDNARALLLVLREGQGRPEMGSDAVRALPLETFTADLARRFAEGRIAAAGPDAAAAKSARVSVRSYLAAAKSVLHPARLAWYRDAGLHLPDLAGFCAYTSPSPGRPVKVKPARELLVKTFGALPELKSADPGAYLVVMLAAGAALRASEIARMELAWLQEVDVEDDADLAAPALREWHILTDYGKGDCPRGVAIDPRLAAEVLSYHAAQSPTWPDGQAFVLPRDGGAAVERARAWMRRLGWSGRMVLHELRAWNLRTKRAQFAAAEQAGLEAAAADAGHASPRTTEAHYTGPVSRPGRAVRLPMV